MTRLSANGENGRGIRRAGSWAALVIAAALAKGLGVLWLVPPFQTPDEYGHYDYALYLAHVDPVAFLSGNVATPVAVSFSDYTTRELYALADATGTAAHAREAIVARPPLPLAEMHRRAGSAGDHDAHARLSQLETVNALFNYPPLYYAIVGGLHRVTTATGADAVTGYYAARLLSLGLFGLTLVVAWRVLQALELDRRLALLVLGLIGFHPQLSLQSIAIQPDTLTLLLTTIGLLLLVRLAAEPGTRSLVQLGLVSGLLALVKVHVAIPLWLTALGVAVVALVWNAGPRRLRSAMVWGTVVALAVGGWWYVRSALLYGNPFGLVVAVAAPGSAGSPAGNLEQWFGIALPLTVRSYWGMWGWLDYGPPPGVVPLMGALLVWSAIVIVVAVVGWPRSPSRAGVLRVAPWLGTGQGRGIAVLGAVHVVFAIEVLAVTMAMGSVANQGRHWLAFVLPQMLLVAGWIPLFEPSRFAEAARRMRLGRRALTGAFVVASAALAVALTSRALEAPVRGTVEMVFRPSSDGTVGVFVDSGRGYTRWEAVSVDVRARDALEVVRLPVRSAEIRSLRVDPVRSTGSVHLGPVRVLDATGREVRRIPPASWEANHDVATMDQRGGGVAVVTRPDARDPTLEVTFDEPIVFEDDGWRGLAGTFRQVVRRVLDRLPGGSRLPATLPWLAPLTLALAVSWRESRQPPARSSVEAVRWAATAGYAALFVAANVWLVRATIAFYD